MYYCSHLFIAFLLAVGTATTMAYRLPRTQLLAKVSRSMYIIMHTWYLRYIADCEYPSYMQPVLLVFSLLTLGAHAQ